MGIRRAVCGETPAGGCGLQPVSVRCASGLRRGEEESCSRSCQAAGGGCVRAPRRRALQGLFTRRQFIPTRREAWALPGGGWLHCQALGSGQQRPRGRLGEEEPFIGASGARSAGLVPRPVPCLLRPVTPPGDCSGPGEKETRFVHLPA